MGYKCGEAPGKGQYNCLTSGCPGEKTLDEDTDVLPPCNYCNKCNWEKVD